MKSISQVAKLTGVSIRTFQYYDEIGLLKPSELTAAGYRMYDDNTLQTLQQILLFKELGFPLKEIKEILEKPDFDRIAAFKKQKELFLLKRSRLDRLIQLLGRLEKRIAYYVTLESREFVKSRCHSTFRGMRRETGLN